MVRNPRWQKILWGEPNQRGTTAGSPFRNVLHWRGKPAYPGRCVWSCTKKGPNYQALADSQIHKLSIVRNSACYLPGQFQQVGTGPAFSAVLIGAAAARQVQATPTTRTKVLNARVISISYMRVPWERKP